MLLFQSCLCGTLRSIAKDRKFKNIRTRKSTMILTLADLFNTWTSPESEMRMDSVLRNMVRDGILNVRSLDSEANDIFYFIFFL